MLEKFDILGYLKEDQLKEVEKIGEIKKYSQEELIVKEGEYSSEIYFIISGAVDLLKVETRTNTNIKFGEILAGETFGEMSFFDEGPRTCSVIAQPNTEVYILSRTQLLENVDDAQEIIKIIDEAITYDVSKRLRYWTTQYIANLQEQIDQLKERNNFGLFFVIILVMALIAILINSCLDDFLPNFMNLYSVAFIWIHLVVIVIPALITLKKFNISLDEVGVTKINFKKSVLDGLIISGIGIILIGLIAFGIDLITTGNQLTSKILKFPISLVSVMSLTYFIHSYMQEFVRATVQTALQRFLLDEKGYFSVFIAAILFGMFHVSLGTQAILVTLVAGEIFGLIYLRSYNLIGVSLVHYLLGYLFIYISLI
ncbi:cyclic nucleotide-binding domain-containing protein [Moorena sp. SIO4G3]|uniref:cyclic nucleotide-binding domain-containing protein n=1 Tax=Moorena sp. SIO4G3 TaxID=2607821 RepID=UPI00142B70B3|nr:cyclic nucleotide-binding domain-containing protein [Moorena sp. SIO4G3]NEO76973.1 cyclic nucleotide-binding domain-containing protein [Moorena sp. SIO4G3]